MATRKPVIYINGYPQELDASADRLNLPTIFRGSSAPTASTADIWYDTTNNSLKMWNGSAFESVGGSNVYIQESAPSSGIAQGDWWHKQSTGVTSIYLSGSINAWTVVGGGGSGGGGTGGGSDESFLENQYTVTTSYTIGDGDGDKNAVSVGPMTIQNGATITVPQNRVWVIL
tara:strand:- start:244 stop:762 length:519 start_codon:yes stop_codon:yes gene_type:complete